MNIPDLSAARAALAATDAPRCKCPLSADVDEFGGTHCPSCGTVDGNGLLPCCPGCGSTPDFVCDKPVNHDGAHGSGYYDEVTADHLRAALTYLDNVMEIVRQIVSDQRTVDDSGYHDNPTDAARARIVANLAALGRIVRHT